MYTNFQKLKTRIIKIQQARFLRPQYQPTHASDVRPANIIRVQRFDDHVNDEKLGNVNTAGRMSAYTLDTSSGQSDQLLEHRTSRAPLCKLHAKLEGHLGQRDHYTPVAGTGGPNSMDSQRSFTI